MMRMRRISVFRICIFNTTISKFRFSDPSLVEIIKEDKTLKNYIQLFDGKSEKEIENIFEEVLKEVDFEEEGSSMEGEGAMEEYLADVRRRRVCALNLTL